MDFATLTTEREQNNSYILKHRKLSLVELEQEVLDVCNLHFNMTQGKHYYPETMFEALNEIHHCLYVTAKRCHCPEHFSSNEESLECLFKLY